MPRVIISGAPGVGKTALLLALAQLGYVTVPESARAVIAERLARGESPRPDPESFAREVFRRDRLKYDACPPEPALVFFDRCAVESLGMVHECAELSDTELQSQLSALQFHRTVFMLPPWEAIYRTDAERDHTFSQAIRVHQSLIAWYQGCGFILDEVPRISVGERVQHVLHALSDA